MRLAVTSHDALVRGHERFDIFCSPCHSIAGRWRRHDRAPRLSPSAVVPHRPASLGTGRALLCRHDSRLRGNALVRYASIAGGPLGNHRLHSRAAIEPACTDRVTRGRGPPAVAVRGLRPAQPGRDGDDARVARCTPERSPRGRCRTRRAGDLRDGRRVRCARVLQRMACELAVPAWHRARRHDVRDDSRAHRRPLGRGAAGAARSRDADASAVRIVCPAAGVRVAAAVRMGAAGSRRRERPAAAEAVVAQRPGISRAQRRLVHAMDWSGHGVRAATRCCR